jgi:hypothetical protein
MQARVIFEKKINEELINIHIEITNLQYTVNHMEDSQYTLQTNWLNQFGTCVDNSGDDFDLALSNVDMEMTSQIGQWFKEEDEEEEKYKENIQVDFIDDEVLNELVFFFL